MKRLWLALSFGVLAPACVDWDTAEDGGCKQRPDLCISASDDAGSDAGVTVDAGTPDAGVDAGTPDAGDSGTSDAGLDAGDGG